VPQVAGDTERSECWSCPVVRRRLAARLARIQQTALVSRAVERWTDGVNPASRALAVRSHSSFADEFFLRSRR
jgi:hypothetical protein